MYFDVFSNLKKCQKNFDENRRRRRFITYANLWQNYDNLWRQQMTHLTSIDINWRQLTLTYVNQKFIWLKNYDRYDVLCAFHFFYFLSCFWRFLKFKKISFIMKIVNDMNDIRLRGVVSKNQTVAVLSSFKRKISLFFCFFMNSKSKNKVINRIS